MRYRSTIALFLLTLVLAGFYFLYLKPKAAERGQIEDFERQFFRADPKEIEFIRIETGDGTVDVVRTGDEWVIEKPKRYRPDRQALSKMFDALSQGRLIKVVGSAGERKTFGLDRPYIIVSLGFSGKTDVLEIADKSPTAKGYYAYNRRFGKVFLVNEEFVRDFNLDLYDLREKRLFPLDRDAITRVRVKRARDTIDVAKDVDAWIMKSPVAGQASPEDVERLVQTIAVQRAAGFVDWTPELSRLPRRLSLEVFDGRTRRLDAADVYYWGTGGDHGALVHRAGSPEAARTSRDFFNLLDGDASLFRSRGLFNASPDDVVKISVTEEETTHVIEKKDGWKKDGVPVPEKKVLSLIEFLRDMKAVKLLQESRPLGKTRFVFEVRTATSASRLEVTNFSMDREMSTSAMFVPVKPGAPGGRKKVDYWYALSRNLGTGVVVTSLDIDNIREQMRKLDDE